MLLRLQKEKTDQDKEVVKLHNAINTFRDKMIAYESEKVQLVENDTLGQKKSSFEQANA